ncbi:3,4-dihydroxy-2-butanone 4-phosphate synthase [Schizosaccharomyces cryophilus OY26]|uniref:3,4-dihydroxy-2-butanone 4-phosphate synthase n=1 Tax=Schizosaccharomyces cryophilus (strain OY26 / ATCC MYA-4695 / CBS 11777 / NBRC 106824 / NRRL Y48691) TaxID=653667 RepID=S9W521_SCHCR|nr:3,4-dihydroxy-2-butanone 4-phosphate synthase [Schizosaccharomyces cryophilus OY26]EPY53634.1 3,4-dihydroxy-2-butanone 4-phosphate synthase [Schizosaccharomyces cryophilus OY26]
MLSSIEEAIQDFKKGKFLVVLDDENRENEGDLIIAGANLTTEQMAFLVRHSSGYVCVPTTAERLNELNIPMMVENNEERMRTAYAVTVDFTEGVTTGISAHDRALTTRQLANPELKNPKAFNRPGHIVPLRAQRGGVLARDGHTEAAVDLCKLAGLPPVAAICELVRDEDGLMSRYDDCAQFSSQWGIKMITIKSLVEYIKKHPL